MAFRKEAFDVDKTAHQLKRTMGWNFGFFHLKGRQDAFKFGIETDYSAIPKKEML
jgi:hypothetical protein